MTTTLTLEKTFHIKRRSRGRQTLHEGPDPQSVVEKGRVPRISRLMALAIRFEGLVRAGTVRDYASLARLGRVTRARISQIMNLLHLAPDIQEQLLFLPRTIQGRDAIKLAALQPLAQELDWRRQRVLWQSFPRP